MVFAANGGKVSPDKVAKRKEPFRYRWQKKKDGRFGYQDALVNSENADNAKEKKAVRTPKSEAADDESVSISIHSNRLNDCHTAISHPRLLDTLRFNPSHILSYC